MAKIDWTKVIPGTRLLDSKNHRIGSWPFNETSIVKFHRLRDNESIDVTVDGKVSFNWYTFRFKLANGIQPIKRNTNIKVPYGKR